MQSIGLFVICWFRMKQENGSDDSADDDDKDGEDDEGEDDEDN